MKRLAGLLLGFLLTVGQVGAQEAGVEAKFDSNDGSYGTTIESQSYTYVIKEDGTARVWMRADGVTIPKAGGEYKLTLPTGATGEWLGWYRENGCPEYVGLNCIWRAGNQWREVKAKVVGNELVLTIPERKVAARDERTPVTIGLSFQTGEVTSKKWWGREVTIVTGKPSQFVSYLTVGVSMPEGVYARDKQAGPSGWGQTIMEAMSLQSNKAASPVADARLMATTMLDMVPNGQVVRERSNVMPGEEYKFSVMSSTERWKLYGTEIGWGVLWIAGIAIVLALILRMLIGKKSLGWYLGLVVLLAVLFVLIMGLWIGYRLTVGGVSDGRYPMPLYKGLDQTAVSSPVEPMVVEPGLEPEMLPSEVNSESVVNP